MKINIVGNIFGSDGFASHVRQLSNALHEQGAEVRIDCPKPQNWQMQVNDAELSMLSREFSEDMTSVLVGNPIYMPLVWAENPEKSVAFVIWEGDKVPKGWIKFLIDDRTDQIWVPSRHVKLAIRNSLEGDVNEYTKVMQKVEVIPHGVDLSIFNPKEKKKDRPFTFAVNKGWRGGMEDRGGVQYTLKAYFEEFTKDDDVRLICKINPSYLPANWDMKTELKNIGIEKKDSNPDLQIDTNNVSFSAIPDFYNEADIFVNSCRCDGFGLPALEAKAMGIPLIQTNFGGQLDYMDEHDKTIDYKLELVTHDIMYEGVQWAVPGIVHLKQLMRGAYENRDKVIPYSKDINNWTWRESAKKISKALCK